MLQYHGVALALKAFSFNDTTRAAYRSIGNGLNSLKKQQGIADKYYFRTPKFLELLRRHDICQPGMNALEIGTGYVHWEAMMLRNEVPCDVTLYDVWDNRTYARFQSYVRQLTDPANRARLGLSTDMNRDLMERVAEAPNFEAAYKLLGFTYLLDSTGTLGGLPDNSKDLIVSSDVGEHMYREDVPTIIERTYDILKPGGHAYHQIVLSDHLKIYARRAHPKQYLAYSRDHYARYLNNGVQYINQIQIPEWTAMFEAAGFEVVTQERIGTSNLADIDVHADWGHVADEDLACTVVQYLLRKPAP